MKTRLLYFRRKFVFLENVIDHIVLRQALFIATDAVVASFTITLAFSKLHTYTRVYKVEEAECEKYSLPLIDFQIQTDLWLCTLSSLCSRVHFVVQQILFAAGN